MPGVMVYTLLRRGLLVILLLEVTGCASLARRPTTLEDLVGRSTQSRGGQKAIEAIKNLEIRFLVEEPTYTAKGNYRVDRRGRMRVDVFMDGKRVFTEAFDGQRAWQFPGGENHARLASPDATAALRHSAQLPTNIRGLHEMARRQLEAAGRESVSGVSYDVLVLTLDDGFTTRYYLDPKTSLITRARVQKALHPDLDPTPTTIESVFGDFRRVAGVLFPFRETQTDLATGKWLQTSTVLDLTPNLPQEDALFQMP
jgi:hypothetical protein